MIELSNDVLVFSFPEVHRDAVLRIAFQRTLRIPDDDRTYPLPPGLGRFPLGHVDDHASRVPAEWLRRGGVMLPLYQSEALWLHFSSTAMLGSLRGYPFAVKVAAGKVNAVTGEPWREELSRTPQDYVAVPEQPWLDGYCVRAGMIRQFVAMPLGSGYSVEEQMTGRAEHGGIQLIVHPLKREAYERMRKSVRIGGYVGHVSAGESVMAYGADMSLGAGGQMRQDIYVDERDFSDWDLTHRGRCFVHLANSLVWRSITGVEPPPTPATAEEYTRAGLPWFEYYAADAKALSGSEQLAEVKSIAQLGQERGDRPLPENTTVDPTRVVELRAGLGKHQVREGAF